MTQAPGKEKKDALAQVEKARADADEADIKARIPFKSLYASQPPQRKIGNRRNAWQRMQRRALWEHTNLKRHYAFQEPLCITAITTQDREPAKRLAENAAAARALWERANLKRQCASRLTQRYDQERQELDASAHGKALESLMRQAGRTGQEKKSIAKDLAQLMAKNRVRGQHCTECAG